MASGPGKTPEEREAADPLSERNNSGVLSTLRAIGSAGYQLQPCLVNVPGHVITKAQCGNIFDATAADDVDAVIGFAATDRSILTEMSTGTLSGFNPWLLAAWKGATGVLRWLERQVRMHHYLCLSQ